MDATDIAVISIRASASIHQPHSESSNIFDDNFNSISVSKLFEEVSDINIFPIQSCIYSYIY